MPISRLLPRSAPFVCGLLLVAAAGADTLKDHFNQTVPLKPGSEVRLTNVNGGVTVDAWDRNEVQIEAEKTVRAGSAASARTLMGYVHRETTNGAVWVRPPEDSRPAVDAATSNGGVHSELPVTGGRSARTSLTGNINGGGAKLYIRTSNGGVRIRQG